MMSEGTKNVLKALKDANIKPVSGCMSCKYYLDNIYDCHLFIRGFFSNL